MSVAGFKGFENRAEMADTFQNLSLRCRFARWQQFQESLANSSWPLEGIVWENTKDNLIMIVFACLSGDSIISMSHVRITDDG